MSFFNKILKGLGFEDDEPTQSIKQSKSDKKKKSKDKAVKASYNLSKNIALENFEQNLDHKNCEEPQTLKLYTQKDVQNAVKVFSQTKSIILNFQEMDASDMLRSLDFVCGAVYALNLKMQIIEDKIYLIKKVGE